MKISIRAAQNKQRGRMRPAGRQFDMPVLKDHLDQHQYWDQHIFLGFCDAQLKSSFITIYLIVRIMLPTILIF